MSSVVAALSLDGHYKKGLQDTLLDTTPLCVYPLSTWHHH